MKKHTTPPRPLTLIQATRIFSNPERAEQWFCARRWPDGMRCPRCGSEHVSPNPSRRPQPYWCSACRRHFSVRTGTVMACSNIPLGKWLLAAYLLTTRTFGISSAQLARDLGVTHRTAWFLSHRIRAAWATSVPKFEGPVEVDETWIGGRMRNRHGRDRRRDPTSHLTIVAGARDRKTRRVSMAVVASRAQSELLPFVHARTARGARIYTDDLTSYRSITYWLPVRHSIVSHASGEYVRGRVTTNAIESVWAMLKRMHKGVYIWWSVKHLPRYLTELEGRYNDRRTTPAVRMRHIITGMVGKRLSYRDLVAGVA